MNLKHFAQEFFLHESIHITMFFSILATFYFLYVTKKEDEGIIHFIFRALNIHQSNQVIHLIKPTIDSLQPVDLDRFNKKANTAHKKRMQTNRKLIAKTIYIILSIATIFIIINIILYYSSGRD